MEHLIIDTDPGIDDAQAILMALAHPKATVKAITVVGGNVNLKRTVANACTILDVADAEQNIPIYAGCDKALVLPTEFNATFIHGTDGLGDINYPPSPRKIESEHAAVALVRLASESPGKLTLVTIGPLTNIAVALTLDPTLPKKIKRLVIMGGAVHAMGNTPNLSAEFNIFADPEAAHVVFENWPKFELIDWETTLAHSLSAEKLEACYALNTPKAKFFKDSIAKFMAHIKDTYGESSFASADALAMAVALEPDIVTKAAEHHITIELMGRYTRGQTTVDWFNRSEQTANARIILAVDMARFYELLKLGLL